jgi:Ca-activated chloride channel family protein
MQPTVKLDHHLLAVDERHHVHAMLELEAPPAPSDRPRPPLAVAVALDRSGSMAGEKLAVAKRCAAWLGARLGAQDAMSLVAFDDEVTLVAPLGALRGAGLASAIYGIPPGGSTNLSGGWLKGVEQLRSADPAAVRKVLLLTDGLANVGIVEPGALVTLAGGAAGDGIATATIGFGDGFDEDLLTAMADAGGGRAHHAETPDAAPAIFAQELEGLSSIVAQNLSVEIRPRPAVEVISVLNEYPAVAVPGGIQLQLGDAYGGDRRRVVLELGIPHLAALGPATVADLVIRYVSLGPAIQAHTLTVPIVANVVSAAEAAQTLPDSAVREEVQVLKAARARQEAIRHADEGRLDAAQALLSATADTLRREAEGLPAPAPLLEDAEELDRQALALQARYDSAVRKGLHYKAHQARRRRGGER